MIISNCTFNFLTDRGWESGTKIVWKVTFTEQAMTSYLDEGTRIASLYLDKGNFSEKIEQLWEELDNYLIGQK